MNPRAIVTVVVMAIFSAAVAASFHAKPVSATMIVCNPQPTPELIRWNKSRINRT